MINGSDGTKYPPFIDTSRSYYLFSAQLCRSVEIAYTSTYKLKGIEVARFTIPQHVLGNVTENPENQGFCTPHEDCLPGGLLNASVCREGAPLVFSQPHFLDGDPILLRNVVGMLPRRNEHQVFIDIEPTAVIDTKSADQFKDEVLQPLKIMQTVQYGLIAVGVFLIACSIIFFCAKKGMARQKQD
nr:hypothetical protein BaRGS_026730 [Batillaria attramentaria]